MTNRGASHNPTHHEERWRRAARYLHRARVAALQGRLEAARAWAQMAARLTPEWDQPWLLLARWTQDPAARQVYLQWVLRRNPRHREARRLLRQSQQASRGAPRVHIPTPRTASPARTGGPWWKALQAFVVLMLIGLLWGLGAWWDARGRRLTVAALGLAPGTPAVTPLWQVPKATATPTPTVTPTPTPTPTPTLTPTPTPTPTPTATPTPTPTFTPSPTPTRVPQLPPGVDLAPDTRWIEVDLSEQKLYAYEGTRLVREFVVSTGRWPFVTVTGVFRIRTKLVSTLMTGPGYYLPDVPYTMYFYKGYAIHGTYWHNNFGTPMSHGCVNMRVEEARWLFEWASVGTIVYVHP